MAGHKKITKKLSEKDKLPPDQPDINVRRVFRGPVAHSRGISLAAKDSEWIGMRTDFATNDSNTLSLFPGVKFSDSTESTTVITKLLVGQTADFSSVQRPQRLFISKHLSTLREQPREEFNPSESDVSSVLKTTTERNTSGSDVEFYDDDDDEPKRATHTKRRKKKSDVKVIPGEASSVSLIPAIRRKSGSRMRQSDESKTKPAPQSSIMIKTSTVSNDADDEYQSQSEEIIARKHEDLD